MAEFTLNIDARFIKWYSGANILFQHDGCDYTINAAYSLGMEAAGGQVADYFIFEDYNQNQHPQKTLYLTDFEYTHSTTFYIRVDGERMRPGDDIIIDVEGLAPGDRIPGLEVKFNSHWQANYGEIKFYAQVLDEQGDLGPVELVKMNSDKLICEE